MATQTVPCCSAFRMRTPLTVVRLCVFGVSGEEHQAGGVLAIPTVLRCADLRCARCTAAVRR